MGMYTNIDVTFQVKNIPKEARDVLLFLNGDAEEPKQLPDHPFFKCEWWKWIGNPDGKLFSEQSGMSWIHVDCDIKNYHYEQEWFLKWLYPYMDVGSPSRFIGTQWYEENNNPWLITKDEIGKWNIDGDVPMGTNTLTDYFDYP